MDCRKAVAVVLLMFLALEILPCAFQEEPTLTADGPRGFACSIEPLQVCDHGDSFLGALANLPVLVPGTPMLIPSPGIRYLLNDDSSFPPVGFHPAIDHPPQLSA